MQDFYEGRRVLVTGAAGFLGSHLVERLISLRAEVVATDAVACPAAWTATAGESSGFRYRTLDIQDPNRFSELVREARPEVLFHLAAIASPRACARDFAKAYEVNVHGTFNVLRVAEPVGHLVFLSSSAVYGAPETLPMDERHPRRGRDPYAVTKILGETLCETYAANYGLRCSIVRNFNAFGPRQAPEYIIPTIIRQALTEHRIEIWNGTPIRDLMFVENTEDAILTIGAAGRTGTFNVGSGRGTRIADLAARIAKDVGGDVPVRDLGREVIGSPALIADNRELRSLGWEERVSFEEGLARTVESYR